MIRRLLLTTLALLAIAAGAAGTAFAHNSLDASTPADGAAIDLAPTDMLLVFAKDVPLDTLTVTLTKPTGVRSELPGSRHGANAKEVLTPLPALVAGGHTVRWRLVGADGHAVTGRVQFTVANTAAVATTTTPTTAPTPAVVAPTSTAAAPIASVAGATEEIDDGTPAWVRWLLRYASYLALMLVAGLLATEAFVWRQPLTPRFRLLLAQALAAVAVLAVLQLIVLAADITGDAPWSSLGTVGVAAEQPVGVALVIRIVLAFAAWLLISYRPPTSNDIAAGVVALLALGMLATWSFAGHARTMGWPWVGVPLDMAHHAAAAAWMGGLLVIGVYALASRHLENSIDIAHRFSRLAARSVGVLVTAGVLQTIRLDGSALLSTTHGRLVLVKVALLSLMLWMADRNRRLVLARFQKETVGAADVTLLRQMMWREFAVGVVVLGVTASMVALPPG